MCRPAVVWAPRLVIVLVLAMLCILALATPVLADSPTPWSPWGLVTIDGSPALNGTDYADAAITKTITSGLVAPGQPITYTLTFSNAGGLAARDVVITDIVPITLANLAYASTGVALTRSAGVPYAWQVADLAPGAGGLITITGILGSGIASGTAFTNTATITTTSEEVITSNNSSAVGLMRGSPLADAPWPRFRRDLAQTGRSPYTGPASPTLKWAFVTEGAVNSSPAIGADGMIYVGSDDGKIYAINPDGTQRWAFTTGSWVRSSPAIGADGTIYVGSDDGKIYAINPDGSQRWAFSAEGGIRSSPTIDADGTVYVGSEDTKLYAITPDGSEKWAFTTVAPISSSPAIGADGMIYVASRNAKLYAIDRYGIQTWAYPTVDFPGGNGFHSSPAIGANGIYLGSPNWTLSALRFDGSLAWPWASLYPVASSPAIGADGTIYVGFDDDALFAVNWSESDSWWFHTGGYVYSSPAVGADGTIYVGSADGKLYAVNAGGSHRWAFATGGRVNSSPAIGADGTIYVGSSDRRLYAIMASADSVPPSGIVITGPTTGLTNVPTSFTAIVEPISATTPITYTWEATGQSPVTHTGALTDTMSFTWTSFGTQVITVTATNAGGTVTATHAVTSGFTCDGVSEIPRAECEALVALYNSTNGPGWTNKTGWLQTATPCSWYGVNCIGGHVNWLQLVDNQLRGSIPSDVGNLANLQGLYLIRNQLCGSIPPALGNLTELVEVNLVGNQLGGDIPHELGNLANVRFLYLDSNQLSGSIPPELGNLANLGGIGLSSNRLDGSIPPEMGNLVGLWDLGLSNNALEGEVPIALTNLTNLGLGPGGGVQFGYNRLTSSNPTVVAFLNSKDPRWATTQTVPPTALQVVETTATSIHLTWTPISYTYDSGYYEVSYALNTDGPYAVHGVTTDKSATGYTAADLLPNTSYYFVVRTFTAAHGDQQNDLWSAYSREVEAIPSDSSISGRVTDANGNGIGGVTISAGAGGSTSTDSHGNYILSGLAAGTYTVRASKGGYAFYPPYLTITVPPSASGQSFSGTALLPDQDTTAPAAIGNLAASPGNGNGEVALSWTAPGDDGTGGGPATRYDMRYGARPFSWDRATKVSVPPNPATPGSTQNMTIQGLFAGQEYCFAVKTADDAGNWSDLSDVACATSGKAPDTTRPGVIRDFRALPGPQAGTVLLTWIDSGNDDYVGTADQYGMKCGGTYGQCGTDWWEKADAVSGERPTPGPAGTAQSMIATDLIAGAGCRFAIRVYDEAGNVSGIACATIDEVPDQATTYADLTISELSINPTSVVQGSNAEVRVDVTVQNIGQRAAPASSCGVYLASSPNGERTYLGAIPVPSLTTSGPGASSSGSLTVRIPGDKAAGTYYIIVQANRLNQVDESNTTNNSTSAALAVSDPNPAPVPTPKVDLYVKGIEVTQAVQCFGGRSPKQCPGGDNSVPLIKDKLTLVRVYVGSVGSREPTEKVTAVLHVDGSETPLRPVNGSITVYEIQFRWAINDSLNFLIPLDLLHSDQLRLRAEVLFADGASDRNPANNRYPDPGGWASFTLQGRARLQVGFLPIRVTIGTRTYDPNVSAIPYDDDYAATVLPIPGIDIARYETFHFWTPAGFGVEHLLIAQLNILYGLYSIANRANGLPPLDQLIGWVITDAVGYGGMSDPTWTLGFGKVAWCALDGIEAEHLAHEMAHNYGRHHSITPPGTSCYDRDGYDKDTDWPDPQNCNIGEVGIDPFDLSEAIAGDHFDLMSYLTGDRWVAPWTYSHLADKVGLAASEGEDTKLASAQSYAIATGIVFTDSTVQLRPVIRVRTDQPLSIPGGSGYSLQLQDDTKTVLSSVSFGINFTDTNTLEPMDRGSFVVAVADHPMATRLVLLRDTQVIGELVASPSPPTVTVTYPNGGESLTGPFVVSWMGSDPDGDTLWYRVQYSADDGATWIDLVSPITATTFLVDAADLRGTEHGRFKVLVSDGFRNAEDHSDAPFRVRRKAPTVSISYPADGSSVPLSSTVTLQAFANDHEDGNIPDERIAWSSNLSGTLGAGAMLRVEGLPAGVHLLTVVVTDTDGMTGTQSVYLEVMTDADNDGMPDPWERAMGLDPTLNDADGDADGEGLNNLEEYRRDTNPLQADTDYDGYDDLSEVIAGSNPLDANSTPPVQQREVALVPGWNLVSVPLPLGSTVLTDVLSSIAGHYDLAYAYDVADSASPWKKYNVAAPAFLNTLKAVDRSMGLWIRASDPVTLVVSSTLPLASLALSLKQGWNLVGYPSQTTRPVTEALASMDGHYDLVYAYDATSPMPWKKYNVSAPAFLNTLKEMGPGWGYWIRAKEDCLWEVP